MVYLSGVKIKHKENCLDNNIKVKRIYIRAFNKNTGRQSFEPLGLICENCFSISLSESYCKKMNSKPMKFPEKYEIKIAHSKGITSFDSIMKAKNRLVSDEELTVK
ncbi:MAG: hypothetical protein ACXWE6_12470 [Nitrososphaeraceae archaeon]